jgi:acyl-CoA synthetase (AMP-forming)/AMP-acid ligase II
MMNIADALDIHARARPDHPALIEGARSLDHRTFADLVRRTASALVALELPPDAPIGLCLNDRIEYVVALMALARAGRLILPMDARWSVGERQRVVDHFRPAIVLGEPGEPELANTRMLPWDAIWEQQLAVSDPEIAFPTGPDLPLVLSLSSGTTGRPKGPVVTHGQFYRRFMTHWINLGLNGRDRFVCATPLYFGGGRTFTLSVLFSGGTVILRPPPFSAEDLVETVASTGATSLFLVPTQYRRLLELSETAVAPLRGLNLLLSSGAPLSVEERRAIRDRLCPNFYEYYASTEGGGVSLLGPGDIEGHGTSVGRPVFAVETEVVDAEHKPLPAGEVGRLRYRGPGVATGYHNDLLASEEAFRDGWFYPGDLAEIDAGGFITLKGRAKDMILRGGVNIYPADIEAALTDHPAVAEAAVVPWPSREMGEEIAAFVRLSAPATTDEILAHCRARLSRYKWPKAAFVVDDLPRNSAGKILKAALAERLPALS